MTVEDDIYWTDLPKNGGGGTLTPMRNVRTTRLVDWVAKMARSRRLFTGATVGVDMRGGSHGQRIADDVPRGIRELGEC